MAAPRSGDSVSWLEPAVFAIAVVVLAFGAQGGAGFGAASGHAIAALQLDRTAHTPLYDLLAAGFVRLPIGEPGFRLGLLAAVLGAATLAGVVAAGRSLLRDPIVLLGAGAVHATAEMWRILGPKQP